MRGRSIRLLWNGIGEAHAECLLYAFRTENGIGLWKQRRKVKIC